jgi:hypothetical protein
MEVVVAQFKDLFRNFPEGTEKTTKKSVLDSRSPGQDSNRRPPEYEPGVLITRPRHSVRTYERLRELLDSEKLSDL